MVDPTTIWKYSLMPHLTMLAIPGFQRFLTVALQGHVPTVWAVVNPTEDLEAVQVWITPTGGPFVEGEYLGTFQRDWFVGHVFWRHG